MTAPVRKATRRPVKPPTVSTVYDGSRLIGEIKPSARGFTARLTSGRRLGAFATEKLAMRAITAATRGEGTRPTEAPGRPNWQPGERVAAPAKTSKSTSSPRAQRGSERALEQELRSSPND